MKLLIFYYFDSLIQLTTTSDVFTNENDASRSFIELINHRKSKNNKDYNELFYVLKNKLELTLKIERLTCNIINCVSDIKDDFIYRLEWMIVYLNQSEFESKILSFNEDCRFNFDTEVDDNYLNVNFKEIEERLLVLLDEYKPKTGSYKISELVYTFRKQFIIPKNQYERIFREIISEVLEITKIKETSHSKIIQKYVDISSLSYEASCQPLGNSTSKVLVNIARPISYDKAQQLAAH